MTNFSLACLALSWSLGPCFSQEPLMFIDFMVWIFAARQLQDGAVLLALLALLALALHALRVRGSMPGHSSGK